MIFSVYVVLAPPIGKIPLNINFIYIAHIHNSSYFSAVHFKVEMLQYYTKLPNNSV